MKTFFVTHLVTSLHISPFENTSSQLKYKLKGLTISTAHAAVVKNAPVRYKREITGISMYLYVAKDDMRNIRALEIRNRNENGPRIDLLKHMETASTTEKELTMTRHPAPLLAAEPSLLRFDVFL